VGLLGCLEVQLLLPWLKGDTPLPKIQTPVRIYLAICQWEGV
jgi:hypothetical protein